MNAPFLANTRPGKSESEIGKVCARMTHISHSVIVIFARNCVKHEIFEVWKESVLRRPPRAKLS